MPYPEGLCLRYRHGPGDELIGPLASPCRSRRGDDTVEATGRKEDGMSFLDKVKETAAKAGEGVKKGAAQVKDKVGDAQLQKKADDDARQIGYLIVAEKTEGTAPPAGEIDRLIAEVVELRAQIAA